MSSTWFSCFCDTDILCFDPLGSLCSSIFDPHSALVGASGGVYALIGGYFMNAVVVGFHMVEQQELMNLKSSLVADGMFGDCRQKRQKNAHLDPQLWLQASSCSQGFIRKTVSSLPCHLSLLFLTAGHHLHPQNFREMIPLLGVFRILTIIIFGTLLINAHQTSRSRILLLLLIRLYNSPLLFPVGVDFGFAFYRRFVSDETSLKVRKRTRGLVCKSYIRTKTYRRLFTFR